MPTLVFWIDVDNTLLDNDTIKEKQTEALHTEVGPELAQRYWDIYEEIRNERGVVDIPLTLERFRERIPLSELDEQTYQHVHSIFTNFPFADELYPHVLEALAYLNSIGKPVIVSDGDLHYQAQKIVNSSLASAVEGRVMLFVHKQDHLDEIGMRYPADHYVVIDDKPQILMDIKKLKGDAVTTLFVKQGKYADAGFSDGFVPDLTVEQIGDVRNITPEQFLHPQTSTR